METKKVIVLDAETGRSRIEEREAEVDDVPMVQKLTPSERREQAYNNDPVIEWDGDMLTVTQAARKWAYYAAEGANGNALELTALISEAKANIRAKYPNQVQ